MQVDILSNNVEAGAVISLYRVGPMVDLCRGPHVPNTSHIKAVTVTNASRAFWRGDTTRDALQRVYGVSFPSQKQLKGGVSTRACTTASTCCASCRSCRHHNERNTFSR